MRDYMDAIRAAGAKALRQSSPAAMAAAEQALDAALLAGSSLGASVSASASATAASNRPLHTPPDPHRTVAMEEAMGDIRDEFAALDATAEAAQKRSPSATAGSAVVEGDYRARLARKKLHVAYANFGQAFRRMMREPKSKRRYVPELNNLLIQSHVLTSQLTAAAPLIASIGSPEPQAIRQALDAIRQHLSDAGPADSAAQPVPTFQALAQALDEMAVTAEKADGTSSEEIHDVKLLAYQCKQMLRSSSLIRQDANAIHLPTVASST
jgi:hypothetical protein